MPCLECGRVQTDPAKGEAPWARAVIDGRQVLVCPDCQRADPRWADRAESCARCGSTRLSIVMGSVVCRACGHERPAG